MKSWQFWFDWVLRKFDSVVPTSSIAIPMVGARPFRFTREGTFHPALVRQIVRDIGLSIDWFMDNR